MKYYYDLHIHSCLSPCGDNDMTPCNLVGMAKLAGLDVIALTDHNSCKNCATAMEAGEQYGIVVIPGMEICTSEEIHMVCLFPSLDIAMKFDQAIHDLLPPIENRSDIFGEQLIMDCDDNIIDKEPYLLINAAGISLFEASRLVREYGGTCYPAHIDKDSFSVISQLGEVPLDCGFTTAEISRPEKIPEMLEHYPALKNMNIVTDSDAHYLEHIKEPCEFLELEQCTIEAVIEYLSQHHS